MVPCWLNSAAMAQNIISFAHVQLTKTTQTKTKLLHNRELWYSKSVTLIHMQKCNGTAKTTEAQTIIK